LGGFSAGELADHIGHGYQAAVLLVLVAPVGGGGLGVAVQLAVRSGDSSQADSGRDD
jgi:hypothetical protein